MPTPSRRKYVQGMRGLAVLMVVLYHAGLPVTGGFSGVDVFFVISGFVIARLLLSELDERGTISIRAFFARRIRRLLPGLVLVIVVTTIVASVLLGGDRLNGVAKSAVAAVFVNANHYFYRTTGGYFDAATEELPLVHTWSLSVEEQFYIAAPALMLLLWVLAVRIRVGQRKVLILAGAFVALASYGLAEWLASGRTLAGLSAPAPLAFYSAPTRAWEFIAGALIAFAEPRLARGHALLGGVCATVGLLGVTASAFLAGRFGPVPGVGVLLPVAAATVLLAGADMAPGTRAVAALSWRPLVGLGNISYSWYLWHWPSIVFARILFPGSGSALILAAALSLGLAGAAYRWVENPIRFSPRLRGRLVPALAGFCVLLTVATATGAVAANRRLAHLGEIDEATLATSSSPSACHNILQILKPVDCTPDLTGDRPYAILVGDSQAGAYSDGVQAAARRLGIRLGVIVTNACPAPRLRPRSGGTYLRQSCGSFQDTAEAFIARQTPDLLILAQSDLYVYDPREFPQPAEAYAQAVQRLAAPVLERGGKLLILQQVPVLKRGPSECAGLWRNLLHDVDRCLRISTTERARSLGASFAASSGLARRDRGVHVFDPASVLCDRRWCHGVFGRRLGYKDGNHISTDGSLLLVDELTLAVRRAMGDDLAQQATPASPGRS